MRRLTLLRHAHALPATDEAMDRHRALSPRGEAEARALGRTLKARAARPTLILASAAERTRATARLVAQALGYPTEFIQREPTLYLASADGILAVLARQEEAFADVILCGHNPGLSILAGRLSAGAVDALPPTGAALFELECADWRTVGHAPARLVAWLAPPFPGHEPSTV